MKDNIIFTEDDKFKPITTTKQSIYMLKLMRGGIKGCRQYEETEEDKMINIANCEALAVAIHSMEQLQKIEAIEEMDKLANHKIRPISSDQSVAIDMCINILKSNIGVNR